MHPFALNAVNLSLDPALNLLTLHIAVDPNVDIVAGFECLPPSLVRS